MRTKTKGTKITAIFIVLTMLMSISTGIMANEPEQDYVVTYQAEEITDTDTLIEMALAQPKSKARSTTITDEQLEVKQLLEVREYKDGSIQKDFASTTLMAVDENGRAASTEYFDKAVSSQASNYGVAIYTQLNYTAKVIFDNIYTRTTFRVNKVTSLIQSNSQSISLSKLTHGYHIGVEFGDLGRVVEVYNPSVGAGYTINSTNSDFHEGWGGANCEVYASVIVDTSKGSIHTRADTGI